MKRLLLCVLLALAVGCGDGKDERKYRLGSHCYYH